MLVLLIEGTYELRPKFHENCLRLSEVNRGYPYIHANSRAGVAGYINILEGMHANFIDYTDYSDPGRGGGSRS
jgi:hypothetical protein